ncbi:hypothetical protein BH10PSE12_BH10PSE12_20690 [soil metagenome]
MAFHDSAIALSARDAESERLAVLATLDLLDTAPEQEFDTIVRCAQAALNCKIALVSIVDDRRQWFKAKCGLQASETPREQAFCAHAVEANALLVVPDATADPRFSDNPLVVGPPHIRFYAGMPVRVRAHGSGTDFFPMGTLCVIDDKPRTLTLADVRVLQDLAQLVESLLNARTSATDAIRLAEERRGALHRLDLSHRQFRQAERMASIGSWRLTLADNRTEWSDQVYVIHGLPIGENPPLEGALDFFPSQSRAQVSAAVARTIESGQPFDLEVDFVTANGERRRVRSMGELELREGQPVALIGVFQDITDRHLMEKALRQTAHVDDLTRIANRARFNQVIDEQIAEARMLGSGLALLLVDLDHFKTVNDRCGHLAGDDVLRVMAAKLQATYLEDCFAARLGGDEFVLLVPARRADFNLTGLLETLLADLRHPVYCQDHVIPVSGTIGASWLTDDVRDRSDMLHRADIALYEAKGAGRGTGRIFGDDTVIAARAGRAESKLRAIR